MTADEAVLLARAKSGDEQAVRTIVRRYNQRLYRLARSVLRNADDAEDALQQAYVQASPPCQLPRRIALLHLAFADRAERSAGSPSPQAENPRDHLHGRCGRRGTDHSVSERAAAPDPERRSPSARSRRCWSRRSTNCRRRFGIVLMARVVEEMSIQETAELLGLKPETVKTRLHRARQLVKARSSGASARR